MRRKVIKLGTNSLLVSLPSKWVQQQGISKGDEVEVEATPSTIRITASKAAAKAATLALSDNPALAVRQISAAYKRGIDELGITYENPKAAAAALAELKNLIGFEVVESGKHSCRIRNLAHGELGDVGTILRRVFLSLLDMAETAEDAIRTGSEESRAHVALAEETIDRLTDFCKRLLNKHGLEDIPATTYTYSLLKDIERLADTYSELSQSKAARIQPLLADIRKALRELYELTYSNDPSRTAKIITDIQKLKRAAVSSAYPPAATAQAQAIVRILDEMLWSVVGRHL
jgi:phosphate uptake regulator